LFLFLPPTCISGWAAWLLLSCWNSVSQLPWTLVNSHVLASFAFVLQV
jgi:hypothetical protein